MLPNREDTDGVRRPAPINLAINVVELKLTINEVVGGVVTGLPQRESCKLSLKWREEMSEDIRTNFPSAASLFFGDICLLCCVIVVLGKKKGGRLMDECCPYLVV